MKRYLVAVTLVFMLGITAGEIFRLAATSWLALAGLAFLLCLLSFRARPSLVPAFLLAAICLLGALWYSLSISDAEKYQGLAGKEIQGEGYILSYPRQGLYNRTFILNLDQLIVKGRITKGPDKLLISVALGEGAANLQPGDLVRFQGTLQIPAGATNPGQFDYRRYLANQGVFFEVRCEAKACTVILPGQGLRTLAAEGRARVAKLLAVTLPPEERVLIMGLLFGDISGMDSREMAAYQRAGVSHLFAVSGFNVAFVLGVMWFFLALFRPSPLVRLILALPLLIGYYFLVGWSASIVRASLMAFLALAALALGRKKDIYISLAGAALVILLINPGELFQAGFQLSFLTAGGIAYFTPWLQERGLGKYLAPAVAAQASSMPLIAYYFNLISLIAPLLNVVAAVISGVVTVLGLLGTILTWLLPIVAKPIFVTCGLLMYGLSRFILWFADLDWTALVVPSPPLFLVILGYLLLVTIPYYKRYRYKLNLPPGLAKILTATCLLFALLLFCLPHQALLDVTFLDVGQGDSIFIFTPGRRAILVDGGGTPEGSFAVGEKVVLPYLRHRGISSLDAVIMTHNHLDHSEGLLELVPQMKVKSFYMPPAESGNQVDSVIKTICRENSIPLQELTVGEKLKLEEGLTMEVLHPLLGDGSSGNNHSLVLRLVYGESSWLLTGDVENEGLEQIMKREPVLRANLLKLPHHGSLSSYHEGFYREVSPQAVVASAGSNLFNHPHPKVVEYFMHQAVPVYSTKQNGAITTKSDGLKIWIFPYIK